MLYSYNLTNQFVLIYILHANYLLKKGVSFFWHNFFFAYSFKRNSHNNSSRPNFLEISKKILVIT